MLARRVAVRSSGHAMDVSRIEAQRKGGPERSPRRDTSVDIDDEAGGRRLLRCAGCGTAIADLAHRIEIAGAHRHVFVNPHGHVFDVGCFASADVRPIGPASDFFSWFPGYAWRVAICNGCGAHLGWTYGERAGFVGLILPRLVEDEGE
jgi:hypothetical protein